MRAVLDRIENGIAVLLVEEIKDEFTVADTELPAGSKAGTWFQVDKSNGQYKIISIDQATTKKNEDNTASLMAKLQAKKGTSKFK